MGPSQPQQNGMVNGMGAGMMAGMGGGMPGNMGGGMVGAMGGAMGGGMGGAMGAAMGGPQGFNSPMSPQPHQYIANVQKQIITRLRQQPNRPGWQSMYQLSLRASHCFQM